MCYFTRLGQITLGQIKAEEKDIAAYPGAVTEADVFGGDYQVETPEAKNTDEDNYLNDDSGLMSAQSVPLSHNELLREWNPFDFVVERIMSLSGERFRKSSRRTDTTSHSASSPIIPEWLGQCAQSSEGSTEAKDIPRPLIIPKEFTPRILSIELDEK